MDLKPANTSQLIFTPHPVSLDGQVNRVCELVPGETLSQFLSRSVPQDMGGAWEVRINGVVVPHEVMDRVRPKNGTVVEVRSLVKKQALYIVAMVALAYFTMGIGTAVAGTTAGAALGLTGTAAALANAAIFMAGAMIINKVLAPKQPKPAEQSNDSVYSIGAARNQIRQYQPFGLLFGRVRIAPDVLSMPYTWYEGNEMYLGMVLTPGLNVGRIEALDNGDTALSSYQGVRVFHSGFTGMPEQNIPLYSNANTIQGAELFKPNPSRYWVERTTPLDTVRVQINLEYILGDQTSKGKPYTNTETIEVQYRVTGTSAWLPLASRTFRNNNFDLKRATISADVPRGQYDIRASRVGQAMDMEGQNGKAQFQWTTMSAIQADDADYTGIPRIGVEIKATGQLNGAPDELRCIAHSEPCPVWNGTAWEVIETSNPGAHMLQYARGIFAGATLVAGMGLPDSMIDIEAYKAFMLHCEANNYTYDYYLKDVRSHDEMLAALSLVGMGRHTWAGGKLSVAWAAQDQPISGVVNMATIKRAQFQVDYTLANMADGIEYTYYDSTKWDTDVIRVASPGAIDPINPATVSGEGVTRHEHAAELARWHLAQSLYQYKDISYSTDLEHMSYRRMSLLSLQHDLTQWGYGGRLVSANVVNGQVHIELDEPVPPPQSGNAYIGLRIPGERSYRVFTVVPFAEKSNQIVLAEPWPSNIDFPGIDDSNPAHDTIWIYDFKQTPGYRVRVVGITPESDLKGASVSVVPESPEYWHYIKTGEYLRPQNQSLLPGRPVVQGLRLAESLVVQGDTVFTEMQADFDILGTAEYCIVTSRQLLEGQWTESSQVAETRTNTARWRIPGSGTYQVTVTPYDSGGVAGVSQTVTYGTTATDLAPPPFDYAAIQQLPGGVRKYSFGYTQTMQPPDFAGAEIRYIAGDVAIIDWDAMTPLGVDGFFTSAVEAVIPPSGHYTFAFRPRNTSGLLGSSYVVSATLDPNLGEQMEAQVAALVAEQQARDQAIADALVQAANDATAKADAVRDEVGAQVDVVAAQVADILAADAWDAATAYPAGDLVQFGNKLYRALQDVPAGMPTTDAAYWEFIGNYTSLGEAVAASISMGQQNASDIAAESLQLDAVQARLPSGSDVLATSAQVATVDQASVNRDTALGQRTTLIEGRMPSGNGALATSAQVAAVDQARVDGDSALAQRASLTEARLPGGAAGTGMLASEASVTSLQQAMTTADQVNANAILGVKASVFGSSPNLIKNPSGELGVAEWTGDNPVNVANGVFGKQFYATGPSANQTHTYHFTQTDGITAGGVYTISGDLRVNSGSAYVDLVFLGASGYIGESGGQVVSPPDTYARSTKENIVLPAGTTSVWVRVVVTAGSTPVSLIRWRRLKLEASAAATPYSTEALNNNTAQAVLQMETEVDAVTNTANASIGLYTDVNGKVAGLKSVNNGTTSTIDFLADVFRVFSSGLTGFEIRDGYQRNYSAGAQLVMGHNFGVNNDLVLWYGPNVGAAACRKSNATIWFDKSGSAYFGGSLSAGVLKNAATSTQVSNTAQVETGQFGTNGNNKVVTYSFSYHGGGVSPTSKAGQTAAATVTLYRSIAGGAWTALTSFNVSGTWTSEYQAGIGYFVELDIGGSSTFTDNTAGTSNFNYKAVVSGGSGWPWIDPQGNPGNQKLTVMSIEG